MIFQLPSGNVLSLMPITQSAKKALRNSLRKKSFNGRRKKKADEATKGLKKFLTSDKKDAKEALKMLSVAYALIDKATKSGTLKKNTAARKKSRLAAMVKKATAK